MWRIKNFALGGGLRKRREEQLWNLIKKYIYVKLFIFFQLSDRLLYLLRDLGMNASVCRKEYFSF